MPFKIVQTVSNTGRVEIVAVPSNWEANNILKWPPKNAQKMVKDGNSKPPSEGWLEMACELKRSNIVTYKEADHAVNTIVLCNETDGDVEEDTTRYKQDRLPFDIDFNQLAQEITNENSVASTSIINNEQQPVLYTYTVPVTPCNQEYRIQSQEDPNQQIQNKISQLEATINKHQTSIENAIGELQSRQKSLTTKVANFGVQLEDTLKQINIKFDETFTRSLTKNQEMGKTRFKQITTLSELNQFETELENQNIRQGLRNTYSVVCTGGKGIDCAYTLAEIIFSRELLCLCSWSGGSRGEKVKIGLKAYKNVLSFFFEMVHSWVPSFTIKDNEAFFKNILKNATKRKNSKRERASTSRQRTLKRPKLNEGKTVKVESLVNEKELLKDNIQKKIKDKTSSEDDETDDDVSEDEEKQNIEIKDKNKEKSEDDPKINTENETKPNEKQLNDNILGLIKDKTSSEKDETDDDTLEDESKQNAEILKEENFEEDIKKFEDDAKQDKENHIAHIEMYQKEKREMNTIKIKNEPENDEPYNTETSELSIGIKLVNNEDTEKKKKKKKKKDRKEREEHSL